MKNGNFSGTHAENGLWRLRTRQGVAEFVEAWPIHAEVIPEARKTMQGPNRSSPICIEEMAKKASSAPSVTDTLQELK